jgi:hypothetical protein
LPDAARQHVAGEGDPVETRRGGDLREALWRLGAQPQTAATTTSVLMSSARSPDSRTSDSTRSRDGSVYRSIAFTKLPCWWSITWPAGLSLKVEVKGEGALRDAAAGDHVVEGRGGIARLAEHVDSARAIT